MHIDQGSWPLDSQVKLQGVVGYDKANIKSVMNAPYVIFNAFESAASIRGFPIVVSWCSPPSRENFASTAFHGLQALASGGWKGGISHVLLGNSKAQRVKNDLGTTCTVTSDSLSVNKKFSGL